MTSSSRGELGDMFVERCSPESGGLVIHFWYAGDRFLVESWPGLQRKAEVGRIFESIKQNKPTRVFVKVGDKEHKISSQTVKGILDGKLTSADLSVE